MQLAGTFLMAGLLAWVSYVVAQMSLSASVRRSASKSLADYYQQKKQATGEALGESILQRLPISIEQWQDHLRWAQRGGTHREYTLGRLVFTALVYGLAGMVIPFINPAPVSLLIPIGAALYPFIALRSKANTARKRVLRHLPETAAIISAELAAGNPPETAVQRAAQLNNIVSGVLQEALAESASSARPLFTRKPIQGTLLETLRKANLPALTAFAGQLDLVAAKGVAGADLMVQIAETLVTEYRTRLQSDVEKLDSRLTMLVMLFYFAPFVIFLLIVFLAPVLSVFSGG